MKFFPLIRIVIRAAAAVVVVVVVAVVAVVAVFLLSLFRYRCCVFLFGPLLLEASERGCTYVSVSKKWRRRVSVFCVFCVYGDHCHHCRQGFGEVGKGLVFLESGPWFEPCCC